MKIHRYLTPEIISALAVSGEKLPLNITLSDMTLTCWAPIDPRSTLFLINYSNEGWARAKILKVKHRYGRAEANMMLNSAAPSEYK